MQNQLAELSKPDLLKRAQGLSNSIKRQRSLAEMASAKVTSLAGGVTAAASGFAIGYAETSIRNKDGTPMSLGPLPLALAAGVALKMTALFFDPAQQVSAAANGALGAYGATMGRGAALKAEAKKGGQVKTGAEEIIGWSDAESDLLNA